MMFVLHQEIGLTGNARIRKADGLQMEATIAVKSNGETLRTYTTWRPHKEADALRVWVRNGMVLSSN